MAFTIVGTPFSVDLGSNGGTTSGFDTTGADRLYVSVHWYNPGGTATLSNNKGHAMDARVVDTGGNNARVQLYELSGGTFGSGTTLTVAGTSIFAGISVVCVSGSATSSAFDQSATANAVGTTIAAGSITPSENNEIVIAAATIQSGTAPSINGVGGFTGVQYAGGMQGGIGYLIQTTTAAANPTFAWDATNTGAAAVIASFKSGSGGGGGGSLPATADGYVIFRKA